MLPWLAANIGTIAVSAVLLVVVFFAARDLVRKKGKTCSCGSCDSCCGCGGPRRGK